MSLLVGVIVVLLLVAANGFFVATEFALVSSRSTRIDQLAATGNRAARMIQRAKNNPTLFISATQLGVTMASLILGWLGEQTFAELVQPGLERVFGLFGQLPPGETGAGPSATAHAVASLLAIVMITFLHITLGEQVPKILALQRSEAVIMFAVQPLAVWAWIFRPFIALLYWFTNLVLHSIGVEFRNEEYAVHSPDELVLLVTRSARAGLLTAPERELVQRAFAFSDQTSGEVMVPRTEIVALPVDSPIDEAIKVALRHRHSRFPVYEQTIDNVVGVLSTKDLLGVVARRSSRAASDTISLRRLIRPPIVVPQGATVAEVLARMKANRQPMAIVLDEYGGTSGIVTLSDLVARLLGSIGDEYAAATHEVRTLADGTTVADGLALVDDVNAQLGTHFDTSEVDTLGGLVFSELGRRPQLGDEVALSGGWRARVERLDGLRIARVRLLPPRPAPVGVGLPSEAERDGDS